MHFTLKHLQFIPVSYDAVKSGGWVGANILEEHATAILMLKSLVYIPAASIVTATDLVLWHTVETRNREYKRNYLYKLLTIFKAILNVIYGSLTLPGKVAKTTGNT